MLGTVVARVKHPGSRGSGGGGERRALAFGETTLCMPGAAVLRRLHAGRGTSPRKWRVLETAPPRTQPPAPALFIVVVPKNVAPPLMVETNQKEEGCEWQAR